MTDLIRRLRGLRVDARFPEATMYEAADEIERLQARLAECEAVHAVVCKEVHDGELYECQLEARLAEAERRLTLIREIAANTIGHKEIRLSNIVTVIDAPVGAEPNLSWSGGAADSASAVQPERCCLDYPRCDCNSPPESEGAE